MGVVANQVQTFRAQPVCGCRVRVPQPPAHGVARPCIGVVAAARDSTDRRVQEAPMAIRDRLHVDRCVSLTTAVELSLVVLLAGRADRYEYAVYRTDAARDEALRVLVE